MAWALEKGVGVDYSGCNTSLWMCTLVFWIWLEGTAFKGYLEVVVMPVC